MPQWRCCLWCHNKFVSKYWLNDICNVCKVDSGTSQNKEWLRRTARMRCPLLG